MDDELIFLGENKTMLGERNDLSLVFSFGAHLSCGAPSQKTYHMTST